MLSARAPLYARYTVCFHFAPFVSSAVGACAKMTCVDLHVGMQVPMKLGSRSKVASLRMYIFRDFDMWKRLTPLSCWGQFCLLLRRFALQVDVPVLTSSLH